MSGICHVRSRYAGPVIITDDFEKAPAGGALGRRKTPVPGLPADGPRGSIRFSFARNPAGATLFGSPCAEIRDYVTAVGPLISAQRKLSGSGTEVCTPVRREPLAGVTSTGD